jgi:hypothetical protein
LPSAARQEMHRRVREQLLGKSGYRSFSHHSRRRRSRSVAEPLAGCMRSATDCAAKSRRRPGPVSARDRSALSGAGWCRCTRSRSAPCARFSKARIAGGRPPGLVVVLRREHLLRLPDDRVLPQHRSVQEGRQPRAAEVQVGVEPDVRIDLCRCEPAIILDGAFRHCYRLILVLAARCCGRQWQPDRD